MNIIPLPIKIKNFFKGKVHFTLKKFFISLKIAGISIGRTLYL